MKVYLPELDPRNEPMMYAKVTYDGISCIMEPHEAAALVAESPGMYKLETILMEPSKFEKLPDFTGW